MGKLDGKIVTCPVHGMKFDVTRPSSPLRVLRCKNSQPIAHKQQLRIHGLLDPSRTVLIEGSDAVVRLHELGVGLVGRNFDKVDDHLLRRTLCSMTAADQRQDPPELRMEWRQQDWRAQGCWSNRQGGGGSGRAMSTATSGGFSL